MYSLWLMPDASISNSYQEIIYNLSEQFQSPIFEPHITILSGITTPIADQTFYELSVLAALNQPFNISFSRIKYQPDIYKALYLKANPVDKLQQLNKDANDIFQNTSYQFQPHLSLVYTQLSVKEQKKLCKSILLKPIQKGLFSSIRLMQTEGAVEEWKLIEEFPFWNKKSDKP